MIDYTLINNALKEASKIERINKILYLLEDESIIAPKKLINTLDSKITKYTKLINQIKSYLLTTLPENIRGELKNISNINLNTSIFCHANIIPVWDRTIRITGINKDNKVINLNFYLNSSEIWTLTSAWIANSDPDNPSIDLDTLWGMKVASSLDNSIYIEDTCGDLCIIGDPVIFYYKMNNKSSLYHGILIANNRNKLEVTIQVSPFDVNVHKLPKSLVISKNLFMKADIS